ncbi:50S ribosomal protein L18 [Sediminispirochaeta smaragdinae]|uniref:Large ribosomal subunit protein uL18 n=1 Tax=Sediminispirochaeta smaragdinae (strain DSM 11293 / JCM 15392 / SEBR 4228) TaxID=573413 RepID=E1RCM5_SEDSS|nr:50S ribosomal protein L18 [Sediminispirochaeta smaragdinae]ADK80105.1 ribosomal protein L18 [Sediminispirochaeta smaragdinae DSM 11293]
MISLKNVSDKRRKWLKRKRHIRKRINGTAVLPRMSVYRSNRHLYVQVIDDLAGNTIASVSTMESAFKGLKPTVENGAKIGQEIGERLKKKKIEKVVFDRNGYLYHGVVKSIADGARKAGIQF